MTTDKIMGRADVVRRMALPHSTVYKLLEKWKVPIAYTGGTGKNQMTFYFEKDVLPLIEKHNTRVGEAQKQPATPISLVGTEARMQVLAGEVSDLGDAIKNFEKNLVAQLSSQNRVLLHALEKHDALIAKMLHDFGVKP